MARFADWREIVNPKEDTEAANWSDCPNHYPHDSAATSRPCRCGACAVCGFQKHTAIHCGTIEHPDRPFGHFYVAK